MADDSNKLKSVFPREVAALELEKMLRDKGKGDRITASEVLDATGYSVGSLRGRIKTWARRKNFVLEAVPNDGYRICPDVELVDVAIRGTKTAARRERENMRTLLVTDQTKLDPMQLRRHMWIAPRVAVRCAQSEQDVRDIKKEFNLTGTRVPLRLIGGGSDSDDGDK